MRDKIGLISRLTENTMQNAWLPEYARARASSTASQPASLRKPEVQIVPLGSAPPSFLLSTRRFELVARLVSTAP